jgi:serine protease AprX
LRSDAAQTNERRFDALWGRGGRRASATAALMLCALGAATAATGAPGPAAASTQPGLTAYVQPSLASAAAQSASKPFDVIVEGERNGTAANLLKKFVGVVRTRDVKRQFRSLDGVQATLSGSQIAQLAQTRGVTAIVANEDVHESAVSLPYDNDQKWAWVSRVAADWTDPAAALDVPTIAIVDSGVDTQTGDFGKRVRTQVDFRTGRAPDGYGHGTFVAGIAAGSGAGRAGVAPTADLVSLRVMDDDGNSTVADVIAACDWILQNKSAYGIRVANLSLHAGSPGSVFFDPLDQAVERLWLNGVVVVAAAGNYGHDGARSNVPFAPGNDPFVITVGASDVHDTMSLSDDDAAPWSAWGYTPDGFAKPELAAPGRYVIAPSPSDSTLAAARPDHVVGHDLIQMSGTSFSAPAVAGAAALILARHPDWTPDRVKGALMVSAQETPAAAEGSLGVGELDVAAARGVTDPPNPNAGLEQFVVADVFDAAAWQTAARSNVAWGDVAWGDVAWGDVAWGDVAWSDAAWSTVAWGDVAWGDVAWGDAAWGDAAWGDSKTDPFLPATPVTDEERDAVLTAIGVTDKSCDPTAAACAAP